MVGDVAGHQDQMRAVRVDGGAQLVLILPIEGAMEVAHQGQADGGGNLICVFPVAADGQGAVKGMHGYSNLGTAGRQWSAEKFLDFLVHVRALTQ